MQKDRSALSWLLKRLPWNLIAVCFLVYWLHPDDRLTDANLAELRIGMPMNEVYSIFGKPLTDEGYRIGVDELAAYSISIDTFSGGLGHESDLVYKSYSIVSQSSWSNSYVVKRLPGNRQPVKDNPCLKAWVGNERCLWVWSDQLGHVTYLLVTPVEVVSGWRMKYAFVKLAYDLDGWKGASTAIMEVLAR